MTNLSSSLPPLLMTSDAGSFAQYTVLTRFLTIAAGVIADNDYPPHVSAAIQALMDEISAGKNVTPLSESYPERDYWMNKLQSHSNPTWLGLMWFFAEALFYQRILDAVQYFQPGPLEGKDPYWKQKQAQMTADIAALAEVYDQFENLSVLDEFKMILHSALWGNRADLTMTALIGGSSKPGLSTRAERDFILVDHTQQAHDLLANRLKTVDVINDNVGTDSLFDLVLADFLVRKGWAQQVRFNLKDRPFFISDAMPEDIRQTISMLQQHNHPAVQSLGLRLSAYLQDGRLNLKKDAFWTSGEVFEQMPQNLEQELAQADLLIFKGDANYRRILGERDWPFETPLEKVAAYFPFPFLALRTIKSEILAGIGPEKASMVQLLRQKDQLTFVNGKYGVIQLCVPGRTG